jgi:mono/diheme cytochrome c family protein
VPNLQDPRRLHESFAQPDIALALVAAIRITPHGSCALQMLDFGHWLQCRTCRNDMNTPPPRPLARLKPILVLLALAGTTVAQAEDLSTSSGAQLFQRFCASCHGKSGTGDGPVAPLFKLLPPDLTGMSRRSGGTFPAERARRIIDGREVSLPHGTREMPVWGLEFQLTAPGAGDTSAVAEATIARLVEHLRSIQKK